MTDALNRNSLVMTGISKSFPGVRALDSVDFDLHESEVHVLLGENGAGKSTLIKILAGVHQPDSGEIRIDGRVVRPTGPDQAERLGVSTIHQEMTLVPELTVAENIYLGCPPRRFGVVDRKRLHQQANDLVERSGLGLDVAAIVADLGIAQRQLVEIAKALRVDARFLIMDEPTAVLGRSDATRLFGIMGELTARGVGIVFISHLLEEVAEVGDRVTVLRDGAKAGEVTATTGQSELVRLMIGRFVERQYPARESQVGQARLDVRDLSRRGVLNGISFTANTGEVLGIGGLIGAGRTELVRALFGADRYDSGEVVLAGSQVPPGDIAASRLAGLAMVPEDRAGHGLVLDASVEVNLGLARLSEHSRKGLVDARARRDEAETMLHRLHISAHDLDQPVATLSGGNQQKIVIGKWLLTNPSVLILDEPTRGIDVGARAEIYALIDELTRNGTTVLLVSSDLPELLGLSDRVLVMADGRLRGELCGADATQQRVMELAASGVEGAGG